VELYLGLNVDKCNVTCCALAYEDSGKHYVQEIIRKKPLDNVIGTIFLQMKGTELRVLVSL